MFNFNPGDIAIIVIVALVLFFGSSKIPDLFRSMGKAVGEFKKGKLEAEIEANQLQTEAQQTQAKATESQSQQPQNDTVSQLQKQLQDLQNQLEQLKKTSNQTS
ncbi:MULTISPECIES: twin-arginine translocase TatA/TatE family subunit [Acidianus]|uniref:Twin arginine-targeting protein translocase n=1 Tax=Candidatus Acidianus copahuensis TaxID=1160895 RepID=A0A031LIU6_9CREN|nr:MULTISPECIES: twin-arginine translocase TatA/TatE family subunit [Acidianus]EZQ02062.1 twin arginine-targeting protein translocase [Candidatus Acidianus copahuensis]NON62100.1 twin-arginine translocase TatA/TatE family subunit [Acidianus sp. RZ1]